MPISWLTATTPAHGLTEPAEMVHTAQETWANDKLTATVQLRCLWAERHAILANILTYGKAWPYHTGSGLRATHGGIASDGAKNTADGSGNSYAEALLTVNFETAEATTPNEDGETVVYSETIEPVAEFATLPARGYLYGSEVADAPDASSDGRPANELREGPGILFPMLDYKITYYNLTSIPAAFITLTGKVNSDDVPSSFFGTSFQEETLLYQPPTISRSVSFGGANKFTLSTRLTFRPDTWNKYYWAKVGGGFYPIYQRGNATQFKPYTPAPFAGILPTGIL